MSVAVMQWVWQHSGSQNAARLVLLAIADCCNSDDGTGAWPSNAELASKTRLSSRAVQVAVKTLENDGELKIEWGGGRGGVNRYMVVMSALNPADSAPFDETPQDLRPAGSAVPQTEEEAQASGPNPAGSAGLGENGNPADPARNPAGSAPGTVKNRQRTSKRSTSRKVADVSRLDVDEICDYLAAKIEANGSKRPTVTDTWRRDARLLLDEKRPIQPTVDKIKALIDWCQNPECFWHKNILSMPKLRKQYDRLRLDALDEYNRKRGSPKADQPYRNPVDHDVYDAWKGPRPT